MNRNKLKGQRMKSVSPSYDGGFLRFGAEARRVTDTLIVLNVAMFGLQLLTGQLLLVYGAKINSLILKGQIWRLFTSAFLHGDFLHLAFNCNALHNIGPLVEATSGHARFASVYLGSAAAGGILSFFMSPHMSIGASGALFGIAGALAMYAWRHRQLMGPGADFLLMQLRDTAAINFMYGLIVRRIDNWGHLGGLIGGAALSYLLGPRLHPVIRNERVVRLVDRPLLPIFATRTNSRK